MVPLSMTLSDLKPIFQGRDIIQCQVSKKWYKRELYLQQQTSNPDMSDMIY